MSTLADILRQVRSRLGRVRSWLDGAFDESKIRRKPVRPWEDFDSIDRRNAERKRNLEISRMR
jgi:hypothetical protein